MTTPTPKRRIPPKLRAASSAAFISASLGSCASGVEELHAPARAAYAQGFQESSLLLAKDGAAELCVERTAGACVVYSPTIPGSTAAGGCRAIAGTVANQDTLAIVACARAESAHSAYVCGRQEPDLTLVTVASATRLTGSETTITDTLVPGRVLTTSTATDFCKGRF
jgi:hypothetical protein